MARTLPEAHDDMTRGFAAKQAATVWSVDSADPGEDALAATRGESKVRT